MGSKEGKYIEFQKDATLTCLMCGRQAMTISISLSNITNLPPTHRFAANEGARCIIYNL